MDSARQPPNPIAIAVYAFPGIMAILYLTGIASAVRFQALTDTTWTLLWSVLMLAGSVLAVTSVFLPRRKMLIGLAAEAIGATLLGVQLMLYLTSLFSSRVLPWFTVIVAALLAAGCIARAVQAVMERRRLVRLVDALKRTM